MEKGKGVHGVSNCGPVGPWGFLGYNKVQLNTTVNIQIVEL